MAHIIATNTDTEKDIDNIVLAQSEKVPTSLWHRLALVTILLISTFFNFYRLGQSGFDTYYPAAVRSMMDNWHNFFFAAYDPGGFVTIDKPPVGFWFSVLSAKLFGFNTFTVLLPEALAGVLAVAVLYHLVRRSFGEGAGLLAALALRSEERRVGKSVDL